MLYFRPHVLKPKCTRGRLSASSLLCIRLLHPAIFQFFPLYYAKFFCRKSDGLNPTTNCAVVLTSPSRLNPDFGTPSFSIYGWSVVSLFS